MTYILFQSMLGDFLSLHSCEIPAICRLVSHHNRGLPHKQGNFLQWCLPWKRGQPWWQAMLRRPLLPHRAWHDRGGNGNSDTGPTQSAHRPA